MNPINRNPSTRDLRIFGVLLPLFVVAFGAVLGARFDSGDVTRAAWIVGGALTAVFFLVPPLRRPIYVGWMVAVFPIGWIVSRVILAVIFFGIVTPIGLALRLFGHDPMKRRIAPEAASYWEPHPQVRDRRRYFRQF